MQASNVLYFLIWAGLFFLMMRFGCGAHILGHGHHHGEPEPGAPGGNPRWAPPEKAVDPVCGMTIATAGARSAVYDGQPYYFCSQSCREKFEAAPASYAKAAATAVTTQGGKHHGC